MEKIFEKFFVLIDKLPAPLQVVALLGMLVLVFVVMIVRSGRLKKFIVQKMMKKLGHISEKDLKVHSLFSRKEVYQNKIDNMRFNSCHKTKAFKIILTAKLNTDLKLAKEFISDVALFEMERGQLCSQMICFAKYIVESYEKEAKTKLALEFGKLAGEKLFDAIMNSPGGFREKRVDRLNRIISQIDEFLRHSQIFDNNIERIEYFLTEIQYALRVSILEAEKQFEKLNGEIDKIVKNAQN